MKKPRCGRLSRLPSQIGKVNNLVVQVVKQVITGSLVILVCFLLFGCSGIKIYGKSANDIRAGLDECHENKLLVLLYVRPDHAIYAIRCFPPPDEVSKQVVVREKTPINLLRPFMEKETIVIQK